MNTAWGFCIDMTWEPMGCAEPSDQVMQTLLVPVVFGIESTQRAFNPQRSQDGRSSMPRPNDIDHVQIMFLDQRVEVRIHQN
jgi:hypothetical protein